MFLHYLENRHRKRTFYEANMFRKMRSKSTSFQDIKQSENFALKYLFVC